MAQYLRDERLLNLTLTENRLERIHEVFKAREGSVPERADQQSGGPLEVFYSYIIRFDGKGYRVFDYEELVNYFRQADLVERVIFVLESKTSLQSNRNAGSYMELRLDGREPENCFLQVASDNSDWVDSSFASVRDVLAKCYSRSRWIRGAWTPLAIQIGGVFAGFLLSLWAAIKISPEIAIENSFFITFFFVLLVFSNLWGYLNQRLLALFNRVFPSIRFFRADRDRLHWLSQAVVGGLVVAVVLILLNRLLAFVGRTLGEFFADKV